METDPHIAKLVEALTPEQRAILDEASPERRAALLAALPYIGRDFPEQDEAGVDRSLIQAQLRLSPSERLRKNLRARLRTNYLIECGKAQHGFDLRRRNSSLRHAAQASGGVSGDRRAGGSADGEPATDVRHGHRLRP